VISSWLLITLSNFFGTNLDEDGAFFAEEEGEDRLQGVVSVIKVLTTTREGIASLGKKLSNVEPAEEDIKKSILCLWDSPIFFELRVAAATSLDQ